MIRQLPASVRDAVLLVGRVVVGVIMLQHGWQKLVTNGLEATTASMTKMGAPFPAVSALFAGVVELVGGAMLILGVATALVGLLMAIDLIGAIIVTGHFRELGAFSWHLEGMIVGAGLILAAVGAGRYSIDHALLGGRREERARASF